MKNILFGIAVWVLTVAAVAGVAWCLFVHLPANNERKIQCAKLCADNGQAISKVEEYEGKYSCWCSDAWKPLCEIDEDPR